MIESQIIKEKRMSAEEAAALIEHDEVLGTSGFTPSGYPKLIPIALAKRARELHEQGQPFQITLLTGASVGDELDGELARANAIKKRLPYQSNPDLRDGINRGEILFLDCHLSHVAQYVRYGLIDPCTTAIVEAVDVTNDGKIYLTMSGGMGATYLGAAKKIFIELNRHYSHDLKGLHDVYVPLSPPNRAPIPIFHPGDRIGTPYAKVDPNRIVGIIDSDVPDAGAAFREPDETSKAIAGNIIDFLKFEEKRGRLPKGLPFQSGVGNVANAVLSGIAHHPAMEPISMYTEVIQDSIFELIDADRLEIASACSLTLSAEGQARFQREIDILKPKFVIRQQEMSNHPEIVRRLGVVAMNTALEMDIFGNINSTHVLGSKMINGIGGSADFTRNSYVSMFMAPSTAKGGAISTIVPMVSHVDQNEHSVQVLVTEQGLADLRGLAPTEKAREVISRCAHPDYREMLTEYFETGLELAPSRHTPQMLDRAFEMHLRFMETGSMK